MPVDEQAGLSVLPVTGIGEVVPGDDLGQVLADALGPAPDGSISLRPGDVVVVTQKVVSKAEGRVVPVDPEDPEDRIRIIRSESRRILRRRGDLLGSGSRPAARQIMRDPI